MHPHQVGHRYEWPDRWWDFVAPVSTDGCKYLRLEQKKYWRRIAHCVEHTQQVGPEILPSTSQFG